MEVVMEITRLIVVVAIVFMIGVFSPQFVDYVCGVGDNADSNVPSALLKQHPEKIVMTMGEWKRVLSPELFHVARRNGTEAPFSGKYNSFFEDGIYYCFVCGSELFSSESKFESKAGWPSFDKPTDRNNITEKELVDNVGEKIDVRCRKCDSHLGYCIKDGPKERTGKRYAINSISLRFIANEK